jgi:hypothetical protein
LENISNRKALGERGPAIAAKTAPSARTTVLKNLLNLLDINVHRVWVKHPSCLVDICKMKGSAAQCTLLPTKNGYVSRSIRFTTQ